MSFSMISNIGKERGNIWSILEVNCLLDVWFGWVIGFNDYLQGPTATEKQTPSLLKLARTQPKVDDMCSTKTKCAVEKWASMPHFFIEIHFICLCPNALFALQQFFIHVWHFFIKFRDKVYVYEQALIYQGITERLYYKNCLQSIFLCRLLSKTVVL